MIEFSHGCCNVCKEGRFERGLDKWRCYMQEGKLLDTLPTKCEMGIPVDIFFTRIGGKDMEAEKE